MLTYCIFTHGHALKCNCTFHHVHSLKVATYASICCQFTPPYAAKAQPRDQQNSPLKHHAQLFLHILTMPSSTCDWLKTRQNCVAVQTPVSIHHLVVKASLCINCSWATILVVPHASQKIVQHKTGKHNLDYCLWMTFMALWYTPNLEAKIPNAFSTIRLA